jgi:hypothetical protein
MCETGAVAGPRKTWIAQAHGNCGEPSASADSDLLSASMIEVETWNNFEDLTGGEKIPMATF